MAESIQELHQNVENPKSGKIKNWDFTVYPILEEIYLQCAGLVSAQQAKHIADTPVHSKEGNRTAGRLLHSTGTETVHVTQC